MKQLKLGPVVHGTLLIAVLLFAYQSWTREKKVESKVGTVTVWSNAKDAVSSITVFNKGKRGDSKQITIERTKAGYIWGKQTFSRPKRRRLRRGQKQPDKPEMITTTNEFVGGEEAEKALEHFANLKAIHDMGKLGEDKLKEYGLDSESNIAVGFADSSQKSRVLIVGNVVFGSTNRYVLDEATGKGYILASTVIDPVLKGIGKLKLRKLHKFKDDDLSKVVMDTGKQKRTLVRATVERNKRKIRTWTDESKPGTPDATSGNFLNRINRLTPTKFEKDLKTDDLIGPLVTISYYDKQGKEAGYFKLYKSKPPEKEDEDDDKKDGDKKDDKDKKGDKDKDGKKTTDPKKTPVKKPPVKKAPVKKNPVKKGVGAGKKKTPGFVKGVALNQNKTATKKPAAKKPPVKKKPATKKVGAVKDPKKKSKEDLKKEAQAKKDAMKKRLEELMKKRKQKKPTIYYVITERTHVLARVPSRAAALIEQDLENLYELGKNRVRPDKRGPHMRNAPRNFRVPKRPGQRGMRRPGMHRPGMRRPGMRRPGGKIPPGIPGSHSKDTLGPDGNKKGKKK